MLQGEEKVTETSKGKICDACRKAFQVTQGDRKTNTPSIYYHVNHYSYVAVASIS